MKKNRKSFSTRSFITLLMAFCVAGLALSGIVLYFAPPCSIAAVTGWSVLSFSKVQWVSLHQVLALVILFLAGIHLFIYNWKTFKCYFRKRRSHSRNVEPSRETNTWVTRVSIYKEIVAAVIVAIVLYFGSFTLITPFGWLHEGSDSIEAYYRQQAPEGPGRGMHFDDNDGAGYFEYDGSDVERVVPEGMGQGRRDGTGAGRGGGRDIHNDGGQE